MRILVTGGCGFIGTNLVKKLLKQRHKVYVLDDMSTGLTENKQPKCKYIMGSVEEVNLDWLYKKCEGFDFVFHLAAKARIQPSFKDPENYISTNFQGTYELVKFCTKKQIPLVYAGSSSHHSGKFKNPYTFSKDMGEEIIQLYQEHFNLKATITRFYNVYGPYQLKEGGYTTLIGRWINNIENNLPCEIYGNGEQRRDFTHVDDIITALVKIMDKQEYGYVFELGRGKNHSVNEVAKMFGVDAEYFPSKPGEAEITLCESLLARTLLKWTPRKELPEYIKELNLH